MQITVENIKCSGCANTISKKLTKIFNTDNISIDIEQGIVDIDINESNKNKLSKALLDLGYPEINSVHGFNSTKAKAKSFVSCAIGKMDK